MATADNLFKFVAVRPAQKISQDALRGRFIRYSDDDSQPTIYGRLLRHDDMVERKQAAAQFILSKSYVAGFGHDAAWVPPLRRILETLSDLVEQHDGMDPARGEAGAWLAQQGGHLAEIKDSIWSSLYAAALTPRTLPTDRKELIDLIRALFFAEHHDAFDTWQKAVELLRARPLVPEALFTVTPQATPAEAPSKPASPTWQKQKLELFDQLRERVHALQNAILEIDTEWRRGLYRYGEQKPAGKPREMSSAKTDTSPRIVTGPEGLPWQLPHDVVESLSDATRRAVTDSRLSLAEDSVVDILNGLESAQRQHYASIQKLGGIQAVKATDLMRLGMETKTLAPELLDQMTSIYDLPWLFPLAETRFDETIVGAVGSVKPVGIGDLLVVKETPWKYAMGDVAHIENVLKSESKDRVHRRLDKTKQTVFTATETAEESERDLQTSDRFELQSEVQSTLERESDISLGVDVSGGYGPVKVTASADFATSTAQSDSISSASAFAQEVTDRSVESLAKRFKESITTTVINEIEETNTHGFDNTAGTGHICGVYRWVDKYTLGQIYNYGRRLMFEFIVPEPASFYLHARRTGATTTLVEPEPLAEDFSFTDIKPGNYETWVNAYQVANVSPPPPRYKVIAKALDQPTAEPKTRMDSLSVPPGYLAKECTVIYSYTYLYGGPETPPLTVIVGQRYFRLEDGDTFATLHDEDAVVPIAISAFFGIESYAMTIEVKCERSDETLQAWQLATYNAIVEAYNQKKAAYDAQVAAAAIGQGVMISGNNPDQNRRIEQEELKRGCLTLFTNQHFADFDATLMNVAPHGYPEFDVNEAMDEALYVQFFEQAFEWDKMSYLFYPYFWGRKEDWAKNSQLTDTDPRFADFLKAGSARVLVPVRRHYEEAILYYLWTNPGEIWNGGELPTIHNELYVSIVDEMMAAADADLANATPVGEPWEIKLPTELVMLQEDATLPDWSAEEEPSA